MINKEKVPRQKWNIGKVVKLIPGKDSVGRVAEVKTSNNVNPVENEEGTDVPMRTILDKDIEHPILNKS